jgi:hypothetical protein
MPSGSILGQKEPNFITSKLHKHYLFGEIAGLHQRIGSNCRALGVGTYRRWITEVKDTEVERIRQVCPGVLFDRRFPTMTKFNLLKTPRWFWPATARAMRRATCA